MPYVVIFHLPRELTFINYGLFFDNDAFRHGLVISVLRVLIGTFAGTMCSSLLAFIISRKKFIFKKGLAVFWTITMYAQAGLVTTMLLYKKLYLHHTFWVYIIPCMVSVLNVMVIRTYMKSIPDSFEESAQLDGAGYMKIFTSIVMPLCKPVYAATALFLAAYQWNAWFDNLIYNHFDDQYATLMYELMKRINDFPYPSNNSGCFPSYPTVTAAGIIVAAIPLIIIYPFFQKWFVTGLTVGGVKE